MYEIDITYFLYLALVIPLLVVVNYIYMLWRKKVQNSFSKHDLLEYISPNRSNFKLNLKLILECLAILCLSIALANPKIGTELKTINREGVDIVFAVDVSKSMLAEDVAPNRLSRSKRIVSEIINSLNNHRVRIIAYAASALPILPITDDYSTAKTFLQSLNTDMLSSQGTAITESINLAKEFYDDEEQTNRVLVILSDGEDHEVNPEDIISLVQQSGMTIISVGLGSIKGSPIPIKENNIIKTYKKNDKGDVVITKLNKELLSSISKSSKGIYIDGFNTEQVVESVVERLKEMDKKEFESKQFVAYKDQFQWFIAFAILFLSLELFVFEKKTYWVKKLNLFNE